MYKTDERTIVMIKYKYDDVLIQHIDNKLSNGYIFTYLFYSNLNI